MNTRIKVYGFLGMVALFAVVGYLLVPYLTSDPTVSKADSTPAASEEKDSSKAADPESATPVELASARSGSISATVSATANLKAQKEIDLISQSEGVVLEIRVEEGDLVQKGDLLCRLDDTESRIRVESTRQKLAQAKLQLEKAKIRQEKADVQLANTREEYARYSSLYQERLVSEREVAQVRYRLNELEHDVRVSDSESRELVHRVEELESDIQQSELEISRSRIPAPFSGYVTRRSVELGQMVRKSDVVFRLGDFNPLQAEVFVSEKDAAQLMRGQEARVLSGVDSESGVQARVARISPIVDRTSGTVKATIEVFPGESDSPVSQLFKPGAFVRIDIRTDTRDGSVLVPKRAIFEEDGETFVFVVVEETAQRVSVSLGYQQGGDVEIVEGVNNGDQVVVAGQGNLKDGGKVRVVGKAAA